LFALHGIGSGLILQRKAAECGEEQAARDCVWSLGEGPLLVFIHGLEDAAYVNESLNDAWESMGRDFTLVTLPGIGHNS
jgi:hypothetical protein